MFLKCQYNLSHCFDNRRDWQILLAFFVLIFAALSFVHQYIKFVFYILALCVFFLEIRREYKNINLVMPFVALILSSFLFSHPVSRFGWHDLIFLLIGAAGAFFTNLKISSVNLFLVFFIGYFLQFFISDGSDIGVDIRESQSPFESTYSFVFGALFVHFFLTKDKLLCVVSLLLTALAFKKAAFVGVSAAALTYFYFSIIRSAIVFRLIVAVLVFFIVYISVFFGLGFYDDFIYSVFEKSSDALSQGRKTLWSLASFDIYNAGFASFLFGHGLGAGYEAAGYFFSGSEKVNLHNDFLKIFYEVGFIGLLLFLAASFFRKNLRSKVMWSYLLGCMVTDNVLIYSPLVFIVFWLSLDIEDHYFYVDSNGKL